MRFIVLREFWLHALFSHLYAALATRSSVLVQDVSSVTFSPLPERLRTVQDAGAGCSQSPYRDNHAPLVWVDG